MREILKSISSRGTLFAQACFFSFKFQVLPAGVKNDMGVNLDMVRPKDDPTTYFNDGLRKIDFILVYEESPKDTLEFPDEMLPTTNGGDNTAMDAEFDQLSK